MGHVHRALLALGLTLLLVLGVACGDDEAPESLTPGAEGTGPAASQDVVGAAGAFVPRGTQQSGISVSGNGKVVATPDLAVIMLGVEARASTVAAARDDAARAMAAIINALKARGVREQDIQTRSFNISPQYTYRDREQILMGFLVSNQTTVIVRVLDQVGQLVDDVALAGGDLTRIQGISFTIEDPTRLQVEARAAAVEDALAKAQQLAILTKVTLGNPVFIAEVAATPVVRTAGVFAESGAFRDSAAPTPISSGELIAQVTIQALFAIQ